LGGKKEENKKKVSWSLLDPLPRGDCNGKGGKIKPISDNNVWGEPILNDGAGIVVALVKGAGGSNSLVNMKR